MEVIEKQYSEPYPHLFYAPKETPQGQKRPLICITPLLGEFALCPDLFWEKHFARYFARHGFCSVVMDRIIFGYDPAKPIGQISDYLKATIMKNMHNLTAIAEQEPIVDIHKVGSYGISFGSIINCMWAAKDKRLKANFFGLTGADIPSICTASKDPLMKSIMDVIYQSTKLSPKDFEETMRKECLMDPIHDAPKIKSKANLLVQARWDRVVPRKNGEMLREALGFPETIYLPCGHYLSVIAAPALKPKFLKFYRKHLAS